MTNRLTMGRPGYLMTTTAAPTTTVTEHVPVITTRPFSVILRTTTPQPTTTTTSTTTVSLTPYSYDKVSLPPPTAEEAALIKVLEEAVKIEHQRREDERIAARQEEERIRSRRHSPTSGSKKIRIPRCACTRTRPTNARSFIPVHSLMKGRVISKVSDKSCRCMTEAERRHLEEELQKEILRPSESVQTFSRT